MWQEFCEGMLLKEPFSLAFILNVDWFQPFTHTKYSVGVIYLTVLNLPCHICYKRENVILIRIIPGPHEPKNDINFYLQPLVKELLELWNGIKLYICTQKGKREKIVRAAVICVSCDLPAGHKTHVAFWGTRLPWGAQNV